MTQKLQNAVDANQVSEQQMQQMLSVLLAVLEERIPSLPPNQAAITKVIKDPQLNVKQKLKITLPIVPMLIKYEGEFELAGGLNVKSAWEQLVNKLQELDTLSTSYVPNPNDSVKASSQDSINFYLQKIRGVRPEFNEQDISAFKRIISQILKQVLENQQRLEDKKAYQRTFEGLLFHEFLLEQFLLDEFIMTPKQFLVPFRRIGDTLSNFDGGNYTSCCRSSLCHAVLGSYYWAFAALRKAASRGRDEYAKHHYIYGLIHGATGNFDDALRELEISLENEPYDEVKHRISEAIQLIQSYKHLN